MGRPRHPRKQVYVSRAIQGRLLVRLGAYFIVYHLFLWHVLFLSHELPSRQASSFTERYWAFCAQHALLLVCMAAVLPILLWDMLHFSQRIAGPFVRFERALKQMIRGEAIAPITLREGDLAMEFLGVFNEFIASRNRELNAVEVRGRGGQAVAATSSHQEEPQAAASHA